MKRGKKAWQQNLKTIKASREQGASALMKLPMTLTLDGLQQSLDGASALAEVARDTWTGSTAPYTSRFASLLRMWR